MKILIACEFSGVVRNAFIRQGHDAVSCDILPTESPGPHYKGDVFDILHRGWDVMIAHPPCTYLTVTANRVFVNNPERWQHRVDALNFVFDLMCCGIDKICIENPVGVISTHINHPFFEKVQWVQPYEYGHVDSKKTGLWLKNLPYLTPTDVKEPEYVTDKTSGKRYSKTHFHNPGCGHLRSITYQGIADAMAEQWSTHWLLEG